MPKRFKITEDLDNDFSICSVQDSNGQTLAISDSAKGTLPKKIQVVLEATHTGINRNKVEYTHFGLEQSVDSWTKDYSKPVLLNHNTHSDPLGRVVNAEYKASVIDASKNCIQLTLEITNEAAIERFLDGRYKTFSIGGYTDSAKCSVCGKDQMTDGWCGHSRGRKYADKECYWTLGKMEYDEISVVNCPADVNAQALSIQTIDTDGGSSDGVEPIVEPTTDENGTTQVPVVDSVNDDILGSIDGLLGSTDDTQEPEAVAEPIVEPQQDDTVEEPITDELQVIKDENESLKASITEKDETIATKDTEIAQLTDKVSELEAKAEDFSKENEGLIKQNVDLARFAHKILCERLADIKIAVGDATIEEREQLVKDYALMTSKQISDAINGIDISSKLQDRTAPHVPHPGSDQVSDGTTDTSASNNEDTDKTLDDYANALTSFLLSKM